MMVMGFNSTATNSRDLNVQYFCMHVKCVNGPAQPDTYL
jgi:hypothetical protein